MLNKGSIHWSASAALERYCTIWRDANVVICMCYTGAQWSPLVGLQYVLQNQSIFFLAEVRGGSRGKIRPWPPIEFDCRVCLLFKGKKWLCKTRECTKLAPPCVYYGKLMGICLIEELETRLPVLHISASICRKLWALVSHVFLVLFEVSVGLESTNLTVF